jgi:hypothetical protein
MWDKIPAAQIGNSAIEPERGTDDVKREKGLNRAVRSLRSFMGESRAPSPPIFLPKEGLKRPHKDLQIHEGRLTLNGREKHRCTAKLSTKNFSWLQDGAKKWSNWTLDNCVFLAVVHSQVGFFYLMFCA